MSDFTLKSPLVETIAGSSGLTHQQLFVLRRELWRKNVVELKEIIEDIKKFFASLKTATA